MALPQFWYDGFLCEIATSGYRLTGKLAVIVRTVDTGKGHMPISAFSVNLQELNHKLKPNEFFARVDRDNGALAEVLRKSGIFEITNQHVHYGFKNQCRAEIWRVKQDDTAKEGGLNENNSFQGCITGDCQG